MVDSVKIVFTNCYKEWGINEMQMTWTIFSQLLTLSEKTNQKEIFMSGTRQLFLEWHPFHSSVMIFCLINSVDVVFTLKLANHTIILLQARMAWLVAHQCTVPEMYIQNPPKPIRFRFNRNLFQSKIIFYNKGILYFSGVNLYMFQSCADCRRWSDLSVWIWWPDIRWRQT